MTDPVVVVGGGVAGLAAAWQLQRDGVAVRVLEARDRVGGKVVSSTVGGRVVDEAADAFLARVPHGVELAGELGLTDQLISPTARSARIWTRSDGQGRLLPLPQPNVLGIPLDPDAAAALLGDGAAAAIRTDIDRTDPDPIDDQETIGSLIRRRLGDGVHDALVDPLLGAINAGDTDLLSLHASSPQLLAAAQANPSLISALRSLTGRRDPDAAVFHSFEGGMGVLVEALAGSLAGSITTGARVEAVDRLPDGLRVRLGSGEMMMASAVIMACPAPVASATLVDWTYASDLLASIPLVSVALVTLVYAAEDVAQTPDVSGFLVPRGDDVRITACSFASSKLPHLGGDASVLRVSVGHTGDQVTPALADDALLDVVANDLRETAGIEAAPRATRISRWPKAFPQYTVGHLDRVAQIEGDLNPDGVFIAGMSYRGIGIPACIDQGRTAAVQAVLHLLE